jgi:hypothetical protein
MLAKQYNTIEHSSATVKAISSHSGGCGFEPRLNPFYFLAVSVFQSLGTTSFLLRTTPFLLR